MANITAPFAGGTTNGTEADDVITSGPNPDTINGLGGNDIIVSESSFNGPDNLAGGAGNDTFRIATNDFGFVNITDFTRGQDKIDVAALGFADLASLMLVGSQQTGLSRFEFYRGGSWNKIDVLGVTLSSFVPSDFIFNTSTASRNLTGTSNFDTLVGGPGPDSMFGLEGSDLLIGGPGGDRLEAGGGSDRLHGGSGLDLLFGGPGRDVATFTGNRSDYSIAVEGYGARIVDLRSGSNDGSDYVEGVEHLAFADETVALALEGFRLLASDGFVGSIGGSGQVFGSAGYQDILVLDMIGSGRIGFDGSFNAGGDIVRLPGNAADWQVSLSGSAALFFGVETEVLVPFGIVGMSIDFDDGPRTLKIDQVAQVVRIGTQEIVGSPAAISAPLQIVTLPNGADPSAQAQLLLVEDASVTASGKLSIFGTAEGESVYLLSGNAVFDGSFNRGGDRLILDQPATAFVASLQGSSVFLDSAATDVRIPFGPTGMDIEFASGDHRTLVLNTASGTVVIGSQQIGIDPIALSASI